MNAAQKNLVSASQNVFAVVSFRAVPRGAFKWAHGGRRGYYRMQKNTVNEVVRIDSPRCLSQISGETGLETAGEKSAYCLDFDLKNLCEKAEKINKAERSKKWVNAMTAYAK